MLGRQLWLLQAAVVGLSCRHDVMELLEKRVRSRFSHRKQLIPEMEEKHFDQPGNSPKDVLAAMLTMPDSDSTSAQTSGPVQQWNAAVSQILSTDAVIQQLRLMMNQGRRSCLLFLGSVWEIFDMRGICRARHMHTPALARCTRLLIVWHMSSQDDGQAGVYYCCGR